MPKKRSSVKKIVHLRVFSMPCCSYVYTHVESRLPNYCLECGASVDLNKLIPMLEDREATLIFHDMPIR